MVINPLSRRQFQAAELLRDYPPKLRHPNKRLLFEIAYSSGTQAAAVISFSRWEKALLPARMPASHRIQIESRETIYDYPPATEPGRIDWHVNFADPNLFVAYGSGLFAQDEMQVAEHPLLGSIREALRAAGEPAVTEENGAATPVIIRGVERRLAVATHPDAAAGRPAGLYGNHFAVADEATIRGATRAIVPPTITNFIAMASPAGGSGEYQRREIEQILATAYTAFTAASNESRLALGKAVTITIHTGFWGCGAFGGNRVLMSILQLLAARLANIDALVFYTFDLAGSEIFERATSIYHREFGPVRGEQPMAEILDRIEGLCLRWGVSDGN